MVRKRFALFCAAALGWAGYFYADPWLEAKHWQADPRGFVANAFLILPAIAFTSYLLASFREKKRTGTKKT